MTTTTKLDLSAQTCDLTFTRGDTFAFTFTVKDAAGTAEDITGKAYEMSVGLEEDPSTGSPTFQVTGTVLTQSGATLGQVQFQFSQANWTAFDAAATAPVDAFYDLQEIDGAGLIWTLLKGKFTVDQDINKDTTV